MYSLGHTSSAWLIMALPVYKSFSNSNTANPGELRSISNFRGGGSAFHHTGSFDVDMAILSFVMVC